MVPGEALKDGTEPSVGPRYVGRSRIDCADHQYPHVEKFTPLPFEVAPLDKGGWGDCEYVTGSDNPPLVPPYQGGKIRLRHRPPE